MASDTTRGGWPPSPLERIAAECRTDLLCAWARGALDAAADAAVLLGDHRTAAWVRQARNARAQLELLIPAHDALARCFAAEVDDGRQHDLFAGDTDTRLMRRWWKVAAGYPFKPGHTVMQRWILMAAHGFQETSDIDGALSRVQAANLLFGHVMTVPVEGAGVFG